MSTAPMKPARAAGKQKAPERELASPDRQTREVTVDVLKDIQRHFVIRTSTAIDDETKCLQISELCRVNSDSARSATDEVTSLKKATSLADQQYFAGLWDAEMKSSGDAMASAGLVPACEQVAVIKRQLDKWREMSVVVIREWAPKFFAIASRFYQQISQAPTEWTKIKLLEGVNKKLQPAQFGAVTFWLRAACGERDKGDVDSSESQTLWRMPAWFVAQRSAPSDTGSDGGQGEQQERHTFKSELRKAIAYFIGTHKKASDQQILMYLREHHLKLVPASWEDDKKLAADSFTKVRRVLLAKEQKRVNGHLSATRGKVTVR